MFYCLQKKGVNGHLILDQNFCFNVRKLCYIREYITLKSELDNLLSNLEKGIKAFQMLMQIADMKNQFQNPGTA